MPCDEKKPRRITAGRENLLERRALSAEPENLLERRALSAEPGQALNSVLGADDFAVLAKILLAGGGDRL